MTMQHETEATSEAREGDRAQHGDRDVSPVPGRPEGGAPEAGPEATVIRLHSAPRAPETERLLDELRAAPTDAPLVLDAADMETTRTPYVLALAAAARARAAAGAPVAVINPAPAFVDAFSDLGLFQDLMNMEFRP